MKRVRAGELVAAAAALVLLAVMFLSWYGDEGREQGFSAWAAFSVVDLLLGLVALLGLALALSQVVGRGPALPVALGVIASSLALIATLVVGYRILNEPGPDDAIDVRLGAWLGLAAVAAIFLGAWAAVADERPRPSDPPAPEPERRPVPARGS